jgi:hypothetical protein
MQAFHISEKSDNYEDEIASDEFFDDDDDVGFPGEDSHQPHLFKREEITISDLPDGEREKVARLVDKLVSLGREQEELVADLAFERSRHAMEMDTSRQQLLICQSQFEQEREELKEQLAEVHGKHRSGLRLLHLYQVSLENFVKDNGVLKDALVTRADIKDVSLGHSKLNDSGKKESGSSGSEKELVESVARLEALSRTQQAVIDATQSANAKLAAENKVTNTELASCRAALKEADDGFEASKKQLAALLETHSAAPQQVQSMSSMEMACEGMARQLADMAAKLEERNYVIEAMRMQIQQQQGGHQLVSRSANTVEGEVEVAHTPPRPPPAPAHRSRSSSGCSSLPSSDEAIGLTHAGTVKQRLQSGPTLLSSSPPRQQQHRAVGAVGAEDSSRCEEGLDSNKGDAAQHRTHHSVAQDTLLEHSTGNGLMRHAAKRGDRDNNRDRDSDDNRCRNRDNSSNSNIDNSSNRDRESNRDRDRSSPAGQQQRTEHSSRQQAVSSAPSSSSSSATSKRLSGLGIVHGSLQTPGPMSVSSPAHPHQQHQQYQQQHQHQGGDRSLSSLEKQSRLHLASTNNRSRMPAVISTPTMKDRDKMKMRTPLGEQTPTQSRSQAQSHSQSQSVLKSKRRVLAFDSERDEYDPQLFALLHDLESRS